MVHQEVVQFLVGGLLVLMVLLLLLRLQDVFKLGFAEVTAHGTGGHEGSGENRFEDVLLVLWEEVADFGCGLDFIRRRGCRTCRGGRSRRRFLRIVVVQWVWVGEFGPLLRFPDDREDIFAVGWQRLRWSRFCCTIRLLNHILGFRVVEGNGGRESEGSCGGG